MTRENRELFSQFQLLAESSPPRCSHTSRKPGWCCHQAFLPVFSNQPRRFYLREDVRLRYPRSPGRARFPIRIRALWWTQLFSISYFVLRTSYFLLLPVTPNYSPPW